MPHNSTVREKRDHHLTFKGSVNILSAGESGNVITCSEKKLVNLF